MSNLVDLADELHAFVAAAPHDYPGHNVSLFERAEVALRLAAQQDGAWQDIETAPADKELLLGWWDWQCRWQCKVGQAQNTRGGWFHGSATHWQPLPEPAPYADDLIRDEQDRNK